MSFIKANEARNTAVNQIAVFNEIQLIEKAIITAANAGKLSVIVGPDSDTPVVSGMTNSSTYYYAFTDAPNYKTDTYVLARSQMDQVISNFQLNGYVVRRQIITSTTTFNWVISW